MTNPSETSGKMTASALSIVLAGIMAYVALVTLHDTYTDSGVFPILRMLVSAGANLVLLFFGWIPSVGFVFGFSSGFLAPLLSFVFWVLVFYTMIRLDPFDRFRGGGHMWLSYVPPIVLVLVVAGPLFFRNTAPELQLGECLAHPSGSASLCLTRVFLNETINKKAHFDDLADVCMKLSGTDRITIVNDGYDNAPHTPADTTYREYCFYQLPDEVTDHGGLDVQADFNNKYLSADFAMAKDPVTGVYRYGETGLALYDATDRAVCEEFGRRTDTRERDRCLAHFFQSGEAAPGDAQVQVPSSAVMPPPAVGFAVSPAECLDFSVGVERDMCLTNAIVEMRSQQTCYAVQDDGVRQYCQANVAMKDLMEKSCPTTQGAPAPPFCSKTFVMSDPKRAVVKTVSVETKDEATVWNSVVFRYAVDADSGVLGLLTVFYDGRIVSTNVIDGGALPGTSTSTGALLYGNGMYGNVKPLPPGNHDVVFRVDPFSAGRLNVTFSDVKMQYRDK